MNIDPRHLVQLSMIVEAGSFQAAADMLGLSQPALSRNIKVLEQRIGAALFDRSARNALPTSLGLRLAQNGLTIRNAETEASNFSELISNAMAGELRIGAPPIIAGHFLTKHISKFVIDRPHCKIDLSVGLVHELKTLLRHSRIDLVIGPRELANGSAESDFLPIVDDRVGILCNTKHVLHSKKAISPKDLEQQRWVAHSRNSTLRQQTESALIAMGLDKIDIAVETGSIQSALEMAADTDLITTMPRETTRHYLDDRLKFLDIDHDQFYRPIGAIYSKNAPENRMVEQFLKLLMA